MQIQAVVIPVYAKYLAVLLARTQDFTTMVWGWQKGANRFASPERLLKKQSFVPFLYRPVDHDAFVTQVALCGLMLHTKDDPCYPARVGWVEKYRVEEFAGVKGYNSNVVAYCVVSSGQLVSPQIAFQDLYLVSEGRPLDVGKNRGYAVVHLPQSLEIWYEEACGAWAGIENQIPKCAA